MKKILFISMLLILCISNAAAQKTAEIKFDKQTYNFGKFSESNPVQKCTFNFTNVGDAPLVINQAMASCGCTVPSYTKAPIAPGGKGTVTVTYNGKGKFPGHFKKSITIYLLGKSRYNDDQISYYELSRSRYILFVRNDIDYTEASNFPLRLHTIPNRPGPV